MGDLIEIIASLEHKVGRLLHTLERLHQTNVELKEALHIAQKENQSKQNAVLEWEEKYNSLQMANAMLGSNTNKTEAKLRINTLIRELDVCIAMLAD